MTEVKANQLKPESHPYKKVVPVISTALAITIFVNSYLRHDLYAMGVQIISGMQKKSNPIMDWFFMIITMTIDPVFVFIGVITMVVASHRKGKGYIMFCFILINTFFAALIKAYHCDPRPIWTKNSIRNIGFYCPIQYGNPSGHSWFSVVLGFGVIMEYRGAGIYYRNIIVSIALIILVPLSRMYLGAHSLNQVLEGLIFGMFFCLLYVINLKDIIHKFLAQFNHKKHWKMVIITLHILSIIPFVLHMDEQLPQKWLDNIDKKCIKHMNQKRLNQLMLTVNALIINVLTGLGLGYEQLVKSPAGAYYLTGRWSINKEKYGSFKGWAFFIGIQVWWMLCGLIGAGVIFKIHQTFVTGYIALSIGGLVSGYMFTTRVAKFLIKYDIIKKNPNKSLYGKDTLKKSPSNQSQQRDPTQQTEQQLINQHEQEKWRQEKEMNAGKGLKKENKSKSRSQDSNLKMQKTNSNSNSNANSNATKDTDKKKKV